MKQRVVIAMALASDPKLLIADEPTTALDVTIQAQILRLLVELQEEFDMSILLITHDLGVVAEIADRVVVLYAGKVMETAGVYDLFDQPSHPYTRALLDCLPGRGGKMSSIGGTLPDPKDPPPGCRFAARCPYAVDACTEGDQPPLYETGDGGTARPDTTGVATSADSTGSVGTPGGAGRSSEREPPRSPEGADTGTGTGTGGSDQPIRASGLGGGRAADDGRDAEGGSGEDAGQGSGVPHRVSCVHFGPGGDPGVVLDDGDAGRETGPTDGTGSTSGGDD
jgi:peptide/nickel transport system ATP-binding protein